MSDCTDGELRDLLPELMHGTLDAETRRAVEAHAASCAECAEELALLRSLRVALEPAPRVDVQRIAAAVNARTTRTTRTPWRAGRRAPWRVAIAAAALLAAGGIGYAVATRHASAPDVAVAPAPTAPTTAPIVAPPRVAPPQAPAQIAAVPRRGAPHAAAPSGDEDADVIGSLADLSDADVRALAASLDTLSGVPGVDPAAGIDPLGASLDDLSGGK